MNSSLPTTVAAVDGGPVDSRNLGCAARSTRNGAQSPGRRDCISNGRSRARELIGFEAAVELREGLRITHDAYRATERAAFPAA